MSKNIKGAIPKWRFESFDSYPKWNIKKLGCLMKPINERAGDKKYILMSVTSGVGLIPQVEKFGREIAGNSYKNYYVIRKNDFAYNKSSTKEFPEGYISMLKEYEEAAIPNSIFTCFRVIDDEYEPLFFEQLFNTNYHGKWLRKYIEIGARAHGALSIDTKHLWNMPVAVPKLPEQQKIADCLSSIDDLISAEEKKLLLLNDYKKGWMQKLLPAEGKTVPEWRFPEFQDSVEWEKIPLGQISLITTGKLDANAMVEDGKYRFYTCAKEFFKIDKYAFDTEALLISGNGANVGYIHYYKGKFNAYQRTYILHEFKKNICYVKYFLEGHLSRRIAKEKNAGNTPYILRGTLSEMEIIIPEERAEQEKIAKFLSGIDDLIRTQTDRIEALKQHKKALMQGLFPAAEEVWK